MKSTIVELQESMELDLPCSTVRVRGASELFSGKPPLHTYIASLHNKSIICVCSENAKIHLANYT